MALVFPPPYRTVHEDLDMPFAASDEVIDGKELDIEKKQAANSEKVREMADV